MPASIWSSGFGELSAETPDGLFMGLSWTHLELEHALCQRLEPVGEEGKGRRGRQKRHDSPQQLRGIDVGGCQNAAVEAQRAGLHDQTPAVIEALQQHSRTTIGCQDPGAYANNMAPEDGRLSIPLVQP